MKQRIRKLALVVSVASLGGAAFIVACSDNSSSGPVPTPSVDAGKTDSPTGTDSSVTPTTDSGVDSGVDADCSKNPILRDQSKGIRCAFMAPDSGSMCQNDQTCCNTESKATGPGFCTDGKNGVDDSLCVDNAPDGSTFNAGKGKAWACMDKNQCGSGEICCMIQDEGRLAADPNNKLNIGLTPKTDTKHPAACGVMRVYNEGGSRCAAPVNGNCPKAEQYKLCSLSDDNCGANATCTPFIDFTNFVDRGYCKANAP